MLFFNPPPSPGAVLRNVIELPFKVLRGGNSTQQQQPQQQEANSFTTVPLRFSPPPPTTTMPLTASGGIVLVADATSDTGKRVVATLLQQGRHVRALVPDIASGQMALSSLPAGPGAKLDIIEQQKLTSSSASLGGIGQLIWPLHTPSHSATSLQTLLNSLTSAGALPKSTGQAVYTPDGLSPAKEWGPVDDVVMGGVSSSTFQTRTAAAEDGISPCGVFTGNVTTANNGGFASTRTRNLNPPLNLAAYDGIELKVRGDGQRYKFVVKMDTSWDGVGYTTSFDTKEATWQLIKIPFSTLVPVFRAKTQSDAAPFDSSRVTSMQLMLSKFEYDGRLNPKFREGKFELPVEYIKSYSEDNTEVPKGVILVQADETSEGGEQGQKEAETVVMASGVAYSVKIISEL